MKIKIQNTIIDLEKVETIKTSDLDFSNGVPIGPRIPPYCINFYSYGHEISVEYDNNLQRDVDFAKVINLFEETHKDMITIK